MFRESINYLRVCLALISLISDANHARIRESNRSGATLILRSLVLGGSGPSERVAKNR